GFFIEDSIKESIQEVVEELKKLSLKAKFVEERNLHVTLSFLGERNEKEIGNIKKTLREIVKNYEKFHVKFSGIELIPSQNFIRVVAIGVKNHENLHKISREISVKLKGDFKPPHLTLCRVKNIYDKPSLISFYQKWKEKEFGTMEIDKISLIKSVLTPKGPIYEKIEEFELIG
ncbi:MAG: RNA 2',3'-cyclic phosphodiesterase, partial [Candidatus Aenigmarchaeota archaeon]|nr:RNA 2',3'-cyclic phosphodiesterase [Candidatus Aenigmarchaeota archaeon]